MRVCVFMVCGHVCVYMRVCREYAECVLSMGMKERAMSLYQKQLRLRKETQGINTSVFEAEVSV